MTYHIKTLNKISSKGLQIFGSEYAISDAMERPQGILVRSAKVDTDEYPGVLAVARAGAGVNNVSVDKASASGVCVFNTPGANANAVSELVFTSLGMVARNIHKGLEWTSTLKDLSDEEIEKQVEKNKAMFSGFELAGKTMGVVGLGKIGVLVANGAIGRGMKVLAYEPFPNAMNMLKLNNTVQVTSSLAEVVCAADFISVHVPLTAGTQNLLNEVTLAGFHGGYILNFARGGIVDSAAVMRMLDSGRLKGYITDFPNGAKLKHSKILCLPHLGASTEEAEENCATMAVEQIKDFLEYAIVRNSVNFPSVEGRPAEGVKTRLAIVNQDVPNMIADITKVIGAAGLNIQSFKNESNGKIGYNLIDLESEVSDILVKQLSDIPKVVRVRAIKF